MKKLGKRIHIIGVIGLCAVLLVAIILVVNLFIYSPVRNYKKDNKLFTTAAQMLVPNAAYASLGIPATKISLFGYADQPFYLKQNIGYSDSNAAMYKQGMLHYRFGKAVLGDNDYSGAENLVVKQSMFIDVSQAQSDENWSKLCKVDNQWYQLWLGFKNAPDGIEYIKQYTWLLENQLENGGVVSTIWKTSNKSDAVALCQPGNYSWFKSNNTTASGMLVDFQANLDDMSEQQPQVQKYLDSGLFGGGIEIDFKERSLYFDNKPRYTIGFVACVKGDLIEKIKKDKNLLLINFRSNI